MQPTSTINTNVVTTNAVRRNPAGIDAAVRYGMVAPLSALALGTGSPKP